jgi:hypothetical protein
MREVKWETGVPSGNHLATYRGIRIVITCDKTGKPVEITWFIGGRVAETMLVDSDLRSAEKTGIMVIDQRIPLDEVWQQAEKDDRDSELWNTVSGSPKLED